MSVFQSLIKVLENSTLGVKNEKIFKVAKFHCNKEKRKGLPVFMTMCLFLYSQYFVGFNVKPNTYPIQNPFLALKKIN